MPTTFPWKRHERVCAHTHPHSFIHTPHTWSLSYTGTHTHTYSLTHRMSFLIAVVTNCHELGDLLSGSSGGRKSPGVSPGQDQGCIPSGGSPSPSSIFTPGDNRQSASPVTAACPLLPPPPSVLRTLALVMTLSHQGNLLCQGQLLETSLPSPVLIPFLHVNI